MEGLQRHLATLDADQVRRLLSASGHEALLSDVQTSADETERVAVDVAQRKAEGNALFKQAKYSEAIEAYTECIHASSRGSGRDIDATLYANRAMAFLKLEQYHRVVEDCSSAIRITPSIKSHLRRATAHVALNQADSALEDLASALAFEPTNREAIRLLQRIANGDDHSRSVRVRATLLAAFRDGWEIMAVKGNPAPPALNGHVLFTVPSDPRQRVFLYGGRAVRDQKSQVFVMDEHDYSWDLVTVSGSPPMPRAWHCVCPLRESTFIVYGGVSGSGEDAGIHTLEAMESPSGSTLTWGDDKVTPSTPSTLLPRSGHACISTEDEDGSRTVVMFGGRTKHGVTNEVWKLTMHDSTVTTSRVDRYEDELVQDRPAPRDGHSMALWHGPDRNKYAVVFGGNGQQSEEKMQDVWLLNLSNFQWNEVKCSGDVPPPRSYHSAHIVAEFMIVIGGRMIDSEDGDVFILDLVTYEWFRVPLPAGKTLPPRAWHASILRTTQDEIYLVGGGTFHGPSRDAAVLNLSKFREMAEHWSNTRD